MYIGAPNKGGTVLEEMQMIREVQKGNMEAFEQLFKLYRHTAIKTVYLMTRDQVMSEDIVQEAFVTCYLSIKSLRSPEYFKTWFFKLLTRTTWRYLKKEKKLVPVEEIVEMVEKQQGELYSNETNQKESDKLLYEEILKLETKLQTTLILYYYNAFSIKEIAKIMSCLEGTVKSRLYTARKKLKMNLVEQQTLIIPREVFRHEN